MPTNIGLGYSAKLVGQTLSILDGSTWRVLDTQVGRAWAYLTNGGTIARITYISETSGWSYPDSSLTYPQVTRTVLSNQNWAIPGAGTGTETFLSTMSSNVEILEETESTPAAAHIIAATVDLTGHQITNLAPGVALTDGVNVSQLNDLNQSLTNLISTGDQASADAIAATNIRIDNLPGGVTMAMVSAEAQRLVGIAVAEEVIDDAQKQAIVDALIAGLADVDASILTDVDALQVEMASLLPRLVALETAKVAQDAVNADQLAVNSAQAGTNAAVQNSLNANAAAITTEAQTNAQQNATLTQQSLQIGAIAAKVEPLKYLVANGLCTSAIGGLTSQCVSLGVAGQDRTYSVTLPATHVDKKVAVYLKRSNAWVEVAAGITRSLDGVTVNLTFKDEEALLVF
ncbi:MAG: hypothetical protein ACRC62_20000 [Microcoleus sp.]